MNKITSFQELPEYLRILLSDGVVAIKTDEGISTLRILDCQFRQTSVIIPEESGPPVLHQMINLNLLCKNEVPKMTTTVLELKANLKHHSDSTVVEIKDVDDEEFAIVNYLFENDKLTIVIGTKEDEEEEGEGE